MTSSSALPRTDRQRDRSRTPAGLFLRGFLKHPVMVGSVVPSSDRLVRRMLERVDWGRTRTFVEYGPGVGTFCMRVLERLRSDAQLIAIDTNADFVRHLRHSIHDPRFEAVHGSATDVEKILAEHGEDGADYILSGLPFSTLPSGVGDGIADATARAIRPGGAFLVYQFSPKVADYLTPRFHRIDRGMEWWNVPPAQLFWAWKRDEAREAD